MIPLMKSTFLNEQKTKEELAKFILRARKLSMDEQCAKFEEEFAAFQGAKNAVLFNSGSSANLTMLQTLKNLDKLKEGDRVGISSVTWSTNLMPVLQLGLQAVLIDCEPTTLNVMSHQLIERLSDTEIRALFITNALGFAGDLDTIREICDEKNIILPKNCSCLFLNQRS